MTNEELAVEIQSGSSGLYLTLWERVKKLVYKIFWQKVHNICLPQFFTYEDLKQEMYFAFCKAVKAYDDTKPYKFTSYLDFHIRNTLAECLKTRSIIAESSYNCTCSEDETTELVEFIEDETAQKRFEETELTDIQRVVRQAVSELPTKQSNAVKLHFLNGLPYTQIAKLNGCSMELIRQNARNGLQLLRRNNEIREIYGEVSAHGAHKDYEYFAAIRKWEYSRERINKLHQIEQRRQNGEYISYGTAKSVLYIAREKFIRKQLGL